MMKHARWPVWTTLLGILGVWGSNASALDLRFEDLPRLLADRNLNIQGASLQVEAAQAQTGHLLRSYLPTVSLELGQENFQTGFYPRVSEPYGLIEGRINLFRGGKDVFESRVKEAQISLTRAQLRQTIALELTEVRRHYWILVFQREASDILKEALSQNEKNLASANRRIQRGLTTDTDRLDFEINRDQLKEDLESLLHEAKITELRLRALLLLPEPTELRTETVVPHAHDDSLIESVLEADQHPNVQLLQANQEVALNQGNEAGRWWAPSLDVYAGYYLYTLRERDYLARSLRDDQVFGARLSWTLFDGLQGRAAAKTLTTRALAFEKQAEQERRTVSTRSRVAQEEMKHAHELIHESEKRIQQGKSYVTKTLSEYDRGVKNSPDVLGALQRQIAYRKRNAELRRDYQISKSELLGILGK